MTVKKPKYGYLFYSFPRGLFRNKALGMHVSHTEAFCSLYTPVPLTLQSSPDHVYRQRENDGGILLSCNRVERLQITEL